MKHPTVAFIGGGNMTRSLVLGLVASDYDLHHIWVSSRTAEKLEFFQDKLGIQITQDNCEVVDHAEVLILAVKPHQVKTVCQEIKSNVAERKPLIISVANGITDAMIRKWLQEHIAVVRAMPNTPASVAASATALYANPHVAMEQRDAAEAIMRAVGLVVWVDDEEQIDAVTALSGAGPAYIFLVMEAMQQAGEKIGLSAETTRLLTLQTVQGAARMALESEQDVVRLRECVTSPGGSTEQAIKVLEDKHIREIFAAAIEAACQRSKELTKTLDE